MNSSNLHTTLQQYAEVSGVRLTQRHPEAVKFLAQKGITPGTIRNHAVKLLTSGTLAASLLLVSPAITSPNNPGIHLANITLSSRQKQFSAELLQILPTEWILSENQEKKITDIVHMYWGISAVPTLDGQRLNNDFGLIGAEQHLPRYPGDSIQEHEELQEAGITPATGAWSYFARSKSELRHEDILREKYYVAVQTLYLPDWNTNTTLLKNWYKYRKVVVINPTNGKIIICDIADAGPAMNTGKHFGGSPEVMKYLDLNKGMKKGKVILFFLDESSQPAPLGPVEYNVSIGHS